MVPVELTDALEDFWKRHGRPTVLVGAAGSRKAPANYPTVKDFYKALLAEIGIRTPLRPDDGIWRLLDPNRIAFELVMERCDQALARPGALAGPMSSLLESVFGGNRSPNGNHVAIIEALAAHQVRAVLTVNFDMALSRVEGGIKTVDDEAGLLHLAGNFASETDRHRIVAHLHSSVRHPDELRAFMSRVGEPVQGGAASVVLAAKALGPLLLVGYSASDPDLTPFVCGQSGCAEDLGVWQTTRSRATSIQHVSVDLDPADSYDPAPTRSAIADALGKLDDADVLCLIGVLRNCSNDTNRAIRDLVRAQKFRPTRPRSFELGRAFEAAGLFRHALSALGTSPEPSDPIYGVWAREAGFYLRMSGDFAGALDQYTRARLHLERDEASHAAALLPLAYREIECRILLASGASGAPRSDGLLAARELIRKCEQWALSAPFRPNWEIDFYRAEADLLEGNYARALTGYSSAEGRAMRWRSGYWSTLAEIRKSLALLGCGRRREAVHLWAVSLLHAFRDRSLLRFTQSLAAAPMFAGGGEAWLWQSRRVFATQVYPRYETLKTFWLRLSGVLPRQDTAPARHNGVN